MKAVLLLYQDALYPEEQIRELLDNAKYSNVSSEAKDLLAATDEAVAIWAQSMNYSPTSHRIENI